ncbi:MAG: YheU family protein, partial [Candidatus Eremiobacteraeota bacterium]|nr:YheU family protein [Candidatus Eremiobacteraeota bacterium]
GGFDSDMSLDERIDELIEKLKTGKAKIMYDPKEGTTNLVPC